MAFRVLLMDVYKAKALKEEKNMETNKNFLEGNKELGNLNLPNLEQVQQVQDKLQDNFLEGNTKLGDLNFPNIKQDGDNFLAGNEQLASLELESLEEKSSGRRR